MDHVAIVTGARRGIGRATAIRLTRDSGAAALVELTPKTLAETAYVIGTGGAEPLARRIDALSCLTGMALRVHNGETKVL